MTELQRCWWEATFRQFDLKSQLLAWGRRLYGIKTSTEMVVRRSTAMEVRKR